MIRDRINAIFNPYTDDERAAHRQLEAWEKIIIDTLSRLHDDDGLPLFGVLVTPRIGKPFMAYIKVTVMEFDGNVVKFRFAAMDNAHVIHLLPNLGKPHVIHAVSVALGLPVKYVSADFEPVYYRIDCNRLETGFLPSMLSFKIAHAGLPELLPMFTFMLGMDNDHAMLFRQLDSMGHLLLEADGGKGKTAFLRQIAIMLASHSSASNLNMFFLSHDLQSTAADELGKLPHAGLHDRLTVENVKRVHAQLETHGKHGDFVSIGENFAMPFLGKKSVMGFMAFLCHMVNIAHDRLLAFGGQDIWQWNMNHPQTKLPLLVLFLDDFDGYLSGAGAKTAKILHGLLTELATCGKKTGIKIFATCTDSSLFGDMANRFDVVLNAKKSHVRGRFELGSRFIQSPFLSLVELRDMVSQLAEKKHVDLDGLAMHAFIWALTENNGDFYRHAVLSQFRHVISRTKFDRICEKWEYHAEKSNHFDLTVNGETDTYCLLPSRMVFGGKVGRQIQKFHPSTQVSRQVSTNPSRQPSRQVSTGQKITLSDFDIQIVSYCFFMLFGKWSTVKLKKRFAEQAKQSHDIANFGKYLNQLANRLVDSQIRFNHQNNGYVLTKNRQGKLKTFRIVEKKS